MAERHSGRAAEADPWVAQASVGRTKVKRSRSSLVALAIGLVVIVAATWFVNAVSVQEIAAEGAAGVHAEAALASATDAYRLAAEAAAEVDEPLPAIAAARVALADLEVRLSELRVGEAESRAMLPEHVENLTVALGMVLDGLDADMPTGPERIEAALGASEVAFLQLTTDLASMRDEALERVTAAGEEARQLAVASRLVVMVVIPLGIVLIYRFSAKRATKRRELRLALEHERRMLRSKDELIANISHELRTPLTGILGFAQMAALDTDLSSGELRTMAGLVATEADELARMVDDLITTARDKEDALALALEDVDPNQELAVVGIPVVIAGYDLSVELHRGPIRADRLRLRQILRNLLSNALKYGGPNVRLEGVAYKDSYYLSVIDDGPGVSRDLEERLFTRFVHRGDEPLMTGSVGLGLSIARRLAEIMGGTLTYARHENETWFTVTLPMAASVDDAASEVA